MDTQPLPIELTLRAIARLEASGVRDPRLTDPDLVARKRFRRKLGFGAMAVLRQGRAERYVLSR